MSEPGGKGILGTIETITEIPGQVRSIVRDAEDFEHSSGKAEPRGSAGASEARAAADAAALRQPQDINAAIDDAFSGGGSQRANTNNSAQAVQDAQRAAQRQRQATQADAGPHPQQQRQQQQQADASGGQNNGSPAAGETHPAPHGADQPLPPWELKDKLDERELDQYAKYLASLRDGKKPLLSPEVQQGLVASRAKTAVQPIQTNSNGIAFMNWLMANYSKLPKQAKPFAMGAGGLAVIAGVAEIGYVLRGQVVSQQQAIQQIDVINTPAFADPSIMPTASAGGYRAALRTFEATGSADGGRCDHNKKPLSEYAAGHEPHFAQWQIPACRTKFEFKP